MEAGAFVVCGEKLVPMEEYAYAFSFREYCTFIEGRNIYCFIGCKGVCELDSLDPIFIPKFVLNVIIFV